MDSLVQPTNVGAVALLERVIHPIHLLFIANEMLHRGRHALLLHAPNRLSGANTLEDRIRPEALPVAAALGLATQGSHGRAEPDVDALAPGLFAHGDAALVHELLVKGGPDGDAVREDGHMVGLADSVGGVVEAELGEADAVSGASVAVASSLVSLLVHKVFFVVRSFVTQIDSPYSSS